MTPGVAIAIRCARERRLLLATLPLRVTVALAVATVIGCDWSVGSALIAASTADEIAASSVTVASGLAPGAPAADAAALSGASAESDEGVDDGAVDELCALFVVPMSDDADDGALDGLFAAATSDDRAAGGVFAADFDVSEV